MKKSICYFYVVFGAACWGFIGLFNRMLGDVGVSVGTRVTVRNLFALALLTVIFGLFHRQVFHIQARHLPIFLGAGILSVLGMAVAYFQCQMLCSLAVAGVLLYLAPSFVVLMSAALWRAPITKRKLAALALALLGCAFVSGIAGGGLTVSLGGILLGVAAGFCYATYTIFAHYGLDEAALASSGVLTYGSNVKEVTTQVSEGAVACGIIYATDAFSAGLDTVDEATADMCGQVIYPAAVLKNSMHADEAKAFLDYLTTDEAGKVFESVGFTTLA